MLHKNKEIKEKQSLILSLFPESLAIANLKISQFEFYNEAFA